MEFSKEKFIEALEIITENLLSDVEVKEVQIKFNAKLYSGSSTLLDKSSGKLYKLTTTITHTDEDEE